MLADDESLANELAERAGRPAPFGASPLPS